MEEPGVLACPQLYHSSINRKTPSSLKAVAFSSWPECSNEELAADCLTLLIPGLWRLAFLCVMINRITALFCQKLKSQGNELPLTKNGFSFPPLNLGSAETGYLTQSNLLGISGRIGAEWQTIGLNLGFSYQQIQQIRYNNRWVRRPQDLKQEMHLKSFFWLRDNRTTENSYSASLHSQWV